MVNDGLLDFVLIRKPKSKMQLPALLGEYKAGVFMDSPRFRDLLVFFRGKKIEIQSLDKEAAANCDGECRYAREAGYEVLPSAVRFLVPAGCAAPALDQSVLQAVQL